MRTTDPDGAPPALQPTPVRAARRPGMRALLSSPPLPDHVETVGYAEPSADLDGQTRGDPEADAWVERLRQRGQGGEHERS